MHHSAPILLIHQGALGDLILSLPALYALRIFSGQAPWTMAGNPETLSLLLRRFYVQEVVSIHQKEWATLFQEELTLPDHFQRYLFSFQKAYLFSSRKPESLIRGLNQAGLNKTFWIPSQPDVQKGLSLQALQKIILASENIPWVETEKTLFPNFEDLQKAREHLDRLPFKGEDKGAWWAIHPGSGSPRKNWPWERFLEVARAISNRNQIQPFFLFGPVEEETTKEMAREIEAQGFPILRNIALPILAGVLGHCAGYLGNDSGVSHLAAALGVPTVILFGPTDPEVWAPKGKNVKIIRPVLFCAPCSLEAARICLEKECFHSLSVSQVLDTILPFF
jgi:ADP-heptose:LPS heptosyltransferase